MTNLQQTFIRYLAAFSVLVISMRGLTRIIEWVGMPDIVAACTLLLCGFLIVCTIFDECRKWERME